MDKFPANEGYSNLLLITQVLITIVFVAGVIANAVALWVLYRSSKTRNNKHVLMLRFLATNDILAQCGMLIVMKVKIYDMIPLHWQCILYVCLRAFGIGSGCVAFIMAVERWLALTRPFVYQKIVTYQIVKRSLFILWLTAVILTYLPFFEVGLYYKDGRCSRYREATELKDVIYAYVFLAFGTALTVCIVLCNASIIVELWKIGRSQRSLVRRCSRSNINRKFSTPEEISFAKLMAAICIIFVICWMPQMVSIPLAQFYPKSRYYKAFGKVADLLMCAYFALNPYVYVLQRYTGRGHCKLPWSKSSKSNSRSSGGNCDSLGRIGSLDPDLHTEPAQRTGSIEPFACLNRLHTKNYSMLFTALLDVDFRSLLLPYDKFNSL